MKYRNTYDQPLAFSFGRGLDFEVPVGGEVEFDDKWHPWVLSRDLYLEVVEDMPATEPEPKKPTALAAKPKPPLRSDG